MTRHLACAMTHVRHEHFFLEKWLAHYGALVGRENLFVLLDGDDWEPRADLSGVNVEVLLDAPRKRKLNDTFMARKTSSRCNALRARYRYVMRMDVDEYVVLDPASGLTWEAALRVVDAAGYLFAVGVDVMQSQAERAPLVRSKAVLGQRRHGFVANAYSKPFVISRQAHWAHGGHRLLNRPVHMSGDFILFHLALADDALAQERMQDRGGAAQHSSLVKHQTARLGMIGDLEVNDALGFEDARAIALAEFPVDRQGRPAARPKPPRHPASRARGLPVIVPDRFSGLV